MQPRGGDAIVNGESHGLGTKPKPKREAKPRSGAWTDEELKAWNWGDEEVRQLLDSVPGLTALKKVYIDNEHFAKKIADEVKMELYAAMQPRGGDVMIKEKANRGAFTWKNGVQELKATKWSDKEVRQLMESLPRLTGLKTVYIDNLGSDEMMADELKMELYTALQPRGGDVTIMEKAEGGDSTWKNGGVQELKAIGWDDKEVRQLLDALPGLTALKMVYIDNTDFDKTIADDLKMGLYTAMQPGGGVTIEEKNSTWKNGGVQELKATGWGEKEVRQLLVKLPGLTALKKVYIEHKVRPVKKHAPEDLPAPGSITDKLKMELYMAMQPQGGTVEIQVSTGNGSKTWKNGKWL